MIFFPFAKINIGLNVVERRPDGYHNLETVFYPVPIYDALELLPMDDDFPSETDCDIKVTGIPVEGDDRDNIVVRAYHLLKADFPGLLPRLHVHLHKGIPTQAGMGGGSSDCASMIVALNNMCRLQLDVSRMQAYAMRLGADCPFFIEGRAAYAEGIGEKLHPISLSLDGLWLAIVRPDIPVSTREAFSLITPKHPATNCREIVSKLPIENWRAHLKNDFEDSVFAHHPEIGVIKEQLYQAGAVYASMSGSGSAVYGLFKKTVDLSALFSGMYCKLLQLGA